MWRITSGSLFDSSRQRNALPLSPGWPLLVGLRLATSAASTIRRWITPFHRAPSRHALSCRPWTTRDPRRSTSRVVGAHRVPRSVCGPRRARPKPPTMQPWGLRIAYVIDPSGVLWHVAERRPAVAHDL